MSNLKKAPKIGVLALQGDFEEHIGALRKLGLPAIEVRTPDYLDELDGLIIPGGESTTIARLIKIVNFEQKIKAELIDPYNMDLNSLELGRFSNEVDIFVMGNDWEGKFDKLKKHCKVVYLNRTEVISTSILKKNMKN